jgi:hypothetical protein
LCELNKLALFTNPWSQYSHMSWFTNYRFPLNPFQ